MASSIKTSKQATNVKSCCGYNDRFEPRVNVTPSTFSLAPNTVVERDAPDYDAGDDTSDTEREPSYIAKILALTENNTSQEDHEVPETLQSIDNYPNNTTRVRNDGNNEDQTTESSEENNDQNIDDVHASDHSLILQSQFLWKHEKDYGIFELVHFDRPSPPERIAAILDSVLEENRSEDVFKSLKTTTIRNKSTASNKTKYSSNTKYVNSPRSLRSLSPSSVSNLPRTTSNARNEYAKETQNNCDKTYSLLAKLQNEDNKKRYTNTISTQSSPTPPRSIYTPSTRPASQISTMDLGVGGHQNKAIGREFHRGSYTTKHLEIDKKKKVKKKMKKKKKEETFTTGLVERAIKSILEEYLTETSYEPNRLKVMAPLLSDLIKARIKNLYPPRYRLICMVNIMERKQQSIKVASLCCWNKEDDTFAEYVLERQNYIAACIVYGVYKE